jgi:hypothetical protein
VNKHGDLLSGLVHVRKRRKSSPNDAAGLCKRQEVRLQSRLPLLQRNEQEAGKSLLRGLLCRSSGAKFVTYKSCRAVEQISMVLDL